MGERSAVEALQRVARVMREEAGRISDDPQVAAELDRGGRETLLLVAQLLSARERSDLE